MSTPDQLNLNMSCLPKTPQVDAFPPASYVSKGKPVVESSLVPVAPAMPPLLILLMASRLIRSRDYWRGWGKQFLVEWEGLLPLPP